MPYRLKSFEYEGIIKCLPNPLDYDWKYCGLDVIVSFIPDRYNRLAISKENSETPNFSDVVKVDQIRFTLNVKEKLVPFWECTEPIYIFQANKRDESLSVII